MCGCQPGYVCSRCAGTPDDDWWLDDVGCDEDLWEPPMVGNTEEAE